MSGWRTSQPSRGRAAGNQGEGGQEEEETQQWPVAPPACSWPKSKQWEQSRQSSLRAEIQMKTAKCNVLKWAGGGREQPALQGEKRPSKSIARLGGAPKGFVCLMPCTNSRQASAGLQHKQEKPSAAPLHPHPPAIASAQPRSINRPRLLQPEQLIHHCVPRLICKAATVKAADEPAMDLPQLPGCYFPHHFPTKQLKHTRLNQDD